MILDYLLQHHDKVLALLIQHIWLVFVAESTSVVVGLAAGVLVSRQRFKKLALPLINVANVGQSIPTLSVIGLTLPLLGIGFLPAVFALFIYSVLPILRNTYAGIVSIDRRLTDTGMAIGLAPIHLIRYIEFPLSSGIILAGIRTSTIFCIGTASLVFLVGGGGLGELIFTGIELVDPGMIIAGAAPVAILAVCADLCFAVANRFLQNHFPQ